MIEKVYSFALFRLVIRSEIPIADNEIYKEFIRDDDGEEIAVDVVNSPLPEKSGTLIYKNPTNELYINENGEFLYSSYPVSMEKTKEYACRRVKDGKITLYMDSGERLWDSLVMEALKLPEILMKNKCAVLHCSFIELDNEAVLFAADSQMGKSTQAGLWNKFRGAQIINGDRAAIRITDGNVFACGIPFCGSSDIAVNKKMPVKAIVFLRKAKENTVSEVNSVGSFTEFLSKLTYEPADRTQLESALELAGNVVEKVPFYLLECLPDESSVEALEKKLYRK